MNHLSQFDDAVSRGELVIGKQELIVEELEVMGRNSEQAKRLLRNFEMLQKLRLDARARFMSRQDARPIYQTAAGLFPPD